VAEQLPPDWQGRGEMPPLSWPAKPLPPRTVAEGQQVLQRTKGPPLREDVDPTADADGPGSPGEPSESPALLGGVQVLVDGGKVVFVRPAPDTGLMRGLWTLLPTSTRSRLWPASFAFSNALEFDALIVPRADRETYVDYTNEDQA